MNIRKGNPEDMKAVLELIQELAIFEKEPEAVVITEEDLIVKEKMRGTGLGSALYAEIMKQGKRDNVRRIEWNVLDWNTPAVNFYKNSGAKILDTWQVVQMDQDGINSFLEKL